ncbi:MAG: hypothetical protein ABJB11_01645 [Ferruginibacter sp.]
MKSILLFAILTGFTIKSFAQTYDMINFEKERIKYDKKSMLVLGSWAVANMAIGAIGTNTNNNQHRYFHQMNVIWNSANLLIAGLGYLAATHEKADNLTLTKVLLHQNNKEKTFIFNAGLDLVYISSGLYLTERSRRNADPSKLKGYGNAVMIQGGFLLLFDVIMYNLHHQHGKKLAAFTDKITLAGSPAGMQLTYRL